MKCSSPVGDMVISDIIDDAFSRMALMCALYLLNHFPQKQSWDEWFTKHATVF